MASRVPDSSRLAVLESKTASSDNSASGSEDKRCFACRKAKRLTKETVRNGLSIVRAKYGLPYSELPDCEVNELSRFLSFLLLQGKERTSVAFPRSVGSRDPDGLVCKLTRLCRRDRWELAHSVNSIKRNLPPGCPRHTPSKREEWLKLACSPSPPPDEGYLAFCRAEVTRLFPPGWDRKYHSYVTSHLPNPTARKPLRSRADLLWAGRREQFFDMCTSEDSELGELSARYKEVLSAGKVRPLLVFDETIDVLAPLHRMVYDHLSKSDWLLVGPPNSKIIASVCVGDVQTSVDLVNATDGLDHSVVDCILDSMFFTSVMLPRRVRRFAKSAHRPVFECGGSEYKVARGQMMGAYLSFPLLCLQSYLFARWATRFDPSARYLVNGDDTVISASRAVTVADYPSGVRLNTDKTITASNTVEVNSTVFLRVGGRWREVRHLRRGGAPSDFPGMLHMAGAVAKQGPAWVGAFWRARIGRRWGFLPSQLGHYTYVSYKRERQMSRRRCFTLLPTDPQVLDEEGLRRLPGVPSAREAEALRRHLWREGRKGGLKRDVFSPSVGKVRRTYVYRNEAPRAFLSYDTWRLPRKGCQFVVDSPIKSCLLDTVKRPEWFLVPEDYLTREEEEGLQEWSRWLEAFDSLALE